MNHRIHNSCQDRPTWLGRSDCRSCKIFKEVLFSDLSKKELETIIQGIYEPIDEFNYAEGAVIYEEGYEDNAIYTIRDGLVKLVRHQSDGEGRIIRLMKSADTIGLERLLGRPYGHTAIALQPVTACRIPIGVLRQLGEEKLRFYRKLMERWANALFQADDYIMMLLSGTVKQRVVQLICWLGEIDHAHKSRVVMLNGRDIAAILDITPESVSRIVAELKRQNILRPRTDGYYEYDAKALKEYSAAA
jgi:CRP/FNR family transcriptional regulator